MNPEEKRPQVIVGVHMGRNRDARGSLIGGAIITLIGLALLLNHLNVLPIERLYRFWPLIIVFWGVGTLFMRTSRTWGAFLILLGTVLELHVLGIMHVGDLWPVLIIALGLFLMWGAMRPPLASSGKSDSADTMNAVAIFGGTERRITTRNFKGGRVNSVFGGVELDFRDADIEGNEAILEVNCVFGGVEIRVPDHWHVHSANIPVLGGYEDKTRVRPAADSEPANKKTLVIRGLVVFGGVEISN
jgi:predicted membrane protein